MSEVELNQKREIELEWWSVQKNGYKNAQKLLAQEYYKYCVEFDEKPLGMSDTAWEYNKEYNKKLMDMRQRKKDDKCDHWCLLITYNPPPENQNWKHVKEIHDNIKRLKFFNPHIRASSIEQRGETKEDMGKGAHFHILVETHTIRKSQWLLKLGQCLSKYKLYKDKVFNPSVDIKWYFKYEQNELTIPKKIAYIEGEKTNDKLKKVEIDKIWREFNKSVIEFS